MKKTESKHLVGLFLSGVKYSLYGEGLQIFTKTFFFKARIEGVSELKVKCQWGGMRRGEGGRQLSPFCVEKTIYLIAVLSLTNRPSDRLYILLASKCTVLQNLSYRDRITRFSDSFWQRGHLTNWILGATEFRCFRLQLRDRIKIFPGIVWQKNRHDAFRCFKL